MCSQPHINYLYINLYIYPYIFKYIYIYISFRSPQRVSSLTKNTPFHSFFSLSPCYPAHDQLREGSEIERSKQGDCASPSDLFIRPLSSLFPICTKFRRVSIYSISRPSSALSSSFSASFLTWPRPEFAVRNTDVPSTNARSGTMPTSVLRKFVFNR